MCTVYQTMWIVHVYMCSRACWGSLLFPILHPQNTMLFYYIDRSPSILTDRTLHPMKKLQGGGGFVKWMHSKVKEACENMAFDFQSKIGMCVWI